MGIGCNLLGFDVHYPTMLDRRDVARLLVKFCGLLIALSAVTSLTAAVDFFALALRTLENYGTGAGVPALATLALLRFGPSFAYLGVGLGIIWWAKRGIDRAAAARDPADSSGAPQLAEIESILIGVLGVYFLCDGIAGLLRTASWIFFNLVAYGAPVAGTIWFLSGDFAPAAVNLGIGILLILRREEIATLRRRIPEWVRRARRWPA